MPTSRLYLPLVIAIVICVLLSAGATWGVNSLMQAGNTTHTTAGATGANGTNGTDGTNGSAGKDGVTGAAGTVGAAGDIGAAGSNGTDGKNGKNGTSGSNGIDGLPGVQGDPGIPGAKGDPGDTGAAGASAPTFSDTPPDGAAPTLLPPNTWFIVAALVGPIPAGPTLVGFSLQATSTNFPVVTCELVSQTTGDVVIAGSPQQIGPGITGLFTATQVVSLPVATPLLLQCESTLFSVPGSVPFSYSNVSTYAISFASQTGS
jgi:hypothetical protein